VGSDGAGAADAKPVSQGADELQADGAAVASECGLGVLSDQENGVDRQGTGAGVGAGSGLSEGRHDPVQAGKGGGDRYAPGPAPGGSVGESADPRSGVVGIGSGGFCGAAWSGGGTGDRSGGGGGYR